MIQTYLYSVYGWAKSVQQADIKAHHHQLVKEHTSGGTVISAGPGVSLVCVGAEKCKASSNKPASVPIEK